MRIALKCLAPLLSVAFGCDPEWVLEVRVTVPADVQTGYQGSYPAQVLFTGEKLHDENRASIGNIPPTRIGILCESRDADQVFASTLSGVGCTVETRIVAWLHPLTGQQAAQPQCGSLGATGVGDPLLHEPPADAPQAEELAFTGQDEADCDGSKGSVSLILQ